MPYTKEKISVNKTSLNGRIVMPPMATAKADSFGYVTDEIISYYKERAEYSGVGLIITEHSFIKKQGKASENQMTVADDGCIEGLAKLADAIHAHGVKCIVQINHAGCAAKSAVTGEQPVAPSAVAHPRAKDPEMPKALTREEIREMTECFAAAALRVKKAGFDGVEIHSAHGYLLNQFYSPITNKRTDEYGARNMENRTRFACETIKAVREAVGEDLIVAIRLGGCDYREGGSTVEDSVEASKRFESAGADLIDITGGMFGYIYPELPKIGYFREMSAAVKTAVNVPVLLTGGVTKLSEAEELLAEGQADLIGVGRAMYKTAHWTEE